ncbi:iron-sulfur cluster biosynthesis [Bacillus sp. sid0103]|uniref:iron-sulfur cluster biosynthesis family protein n=1 Tax=Bacillus sp. sid0103 TaxID=2856337 RepID=UPI001C45016D|nr:iron-sulfur cluster biosynthesis family protein [Bacillus sp. sid0103]MBV7506388.1 iron-sulfur cluster biosynthesis [Bacillus sp. sid0103]
MFTLSENAKTELQNRVKSENSKQFIRLQMRKSCFMKVRLRFEDSIHPNDYQIKMNNLHFIIDNGECHYFNDKTLDFIPDTTGFKQFEII